MGNLCNGNVKDQTYEAADTDEPRQTPRNATKTNAVKNNDQTNDESHLFNCWEKAINIADEDLILKLLTNFSDKLLNHEFSNGDYALHVCTKKGNKEIINHLLSFGDDINKKNSKNGNTALHYAVSKGDYKLCLFLIGKSLGDLIDIKNNNGELPYDLAKKTDDKVLIVTVTPTALLPKVARSKSKSPVDEKELLESYYNGTIGQVKKPNKKDLIRNWEKAINNGDKDEAFALLYDHASDLVDHEFPDGNFAIHICAKKGYNDIMHYLLEYGADITKQNSKNGNTALHYAAKTGNEEIVQYLFFQSQISGCNITEIKNNDDKLAYDYALETNDEDLITFVKPASKRTMLDNMVFGALGFGV